MRLSFDDTPLRDPIGRGKKRKGTKANGYAMPPGTGRPGETCKSCAHLCQKHGTYYKCKLVFERWTGSRGTDVLLKSPACAKWEAKEIEP